MNGPFIEVTLTHDGRHWIAAGDAFRLRAGTLEELETRIEDALGRADEPCDVNVRYDTSSMPAHLRQYQSHYFNYRLKLRPRAQ